MNVLTGRFDRFRMRVAALWKRVQSLGRRAPKRLRLCESLPLGERRFVAVVEFDTARFLVGGTPTSLVLLSRLADPGDPAVEAGLAKPGWRAAVEQDNRRRGDPC